jgi:hypothetical protein
VTARGHLLPDPLVICVELLPSQHSHVLKISFGFLRYILTVIAPASQTPELSMVVEVGVSESAPYLAKDAIAWLDAPGSPVKIAITVKICRKNRSQF